jgi:hypothetical protein
MEKYWALWHSSVIPVMAGSIKEEDQGPDRLAWAKSETGKTARTKRAGGMARATET